MQEHMVQQRRVDQSELGNLALRDSRPDHFDDGLLEIHRIAEDGNYHC